MTIFTDSATVKSVSTPSRTESAQFVDNVEVDGVSTPSITEVVATVDVATVRGVTTVMVVAEVTYNTVDYNHTTWAVDLTYDGTAFTAGQAGTNDSGT